MRICFISIVDQPNISCTMNVRMISSYVKQKGHKSNIIFVNSNNLNLDSITRLLEKINPDVIGISLVTDHFLAAKAITNAIKNDSRIRARVLWGGVHTTTNPEQCLRYADMICRGESEEAVLELLDRMQKGKDYYDAKNFWLKDAKTGKIIKNEFRNLEENLDKYPFPDYDYEQHFYADKSGVSRITKESVRGLFREGYSLLTSRGCPYSCTYCYNNYRRGLFKGKGKYIRYRSNRNIIDEIKYARKRFPFISSIKFWDDQFLLADVERLREFSKLYKKEVSLPFDAEGIPAFITEEKIRLLKDAGLKTFHAGLQSGSWRVLSQVYKRFTKPEEILRCAKILHKYGIESRYDIIFNNPYETKEDLKETIRLLLKFPRPFSIQGFNLVFFPGTEIYSCAVKDKKITLQDSEISTRFFDTKMWETKDTIIYKINFSAKEKKYLNTLVAMTPYLNKKFVLNAMENENALNKARVYARYKTHNMYASFYKKGGEMLAGFPGVRKVLRKLLP